MVSKRFVRPALVLSAVACSLLVAPVSGATVRTEIAEVRFPSEHVVAGERLELRGAALLRCRAFFEAYVAGFYPLPSTPNGNAFEDVLKRLGIEYVGSIDAADLGRAAERLVQERLDGVSLAGLRSRLDELHAAYEPVEPGDRYALAHRPDIGAELSKNGRPLAVILGADFAAAYFSMWLGGRPIDLSLRESLLGSDPTRAQQ